MIKIDMDMPASCDECPLSVYNQKYDYVFCGFTNEDVTQMLGCRHKSCPLKEGEANDRS